MDDVLVRAVQLPAADADEERAGHPWDLPVVRALAEGLDLGAAVTYLIGENGSGMSTLLEAIAIAAGMNAEGARRPRTDFFLRAESLFTAATYLERLDAGSLAPYGGRSLHEQSHGESFLAVILNRFGPGGFYLLDEPEAALSTQNCLTLLRRIDELVTEGSRFVIATHSPIVLAYPGAKIYACGEDGIETVAFEDAPPVRLTRRFLDAPERFLRALFSDEP